MDAIAERILGYIKENGVSKSSFSEKTGINKASLSHLENGRNKASLSLVEAFHKLFPEVDLHWLLTGEKKEEVEGVADSSPTPTTQIDSSQIEKKDVTIPNASTRVEKEESEISEPINKKGNLTVLYADGTYLEYKPRI